MPNFKYGNCQRLRETVIVSRNSFPEKDIVYAYTYIAKCKNNGEIKIGKAVDPCKRLSDINKDRYGPYKDNNFELECVVNTGVCEKYLHLVFSRYQILHNEPITQQRVFKSEKFKLPKWALQNIETTIRAAIELGGFSNCCAEKIPKINEIRATINLISQARRTR